MSKQSIDARIRQLLDKSYFNHNNARLSTSDIQYLLAQGRTNHERFNDFIKYYRPMFRRLAALKRRDYGLPATETKNLAAAAEEKVWEALAKVIDNDHLDQVTERWLKGVARNGMKAWIKDDTGLRLYMPKSTRRRWKSQGKSPKFGLNIGVTSQLSTTKQYQYGKQYASEDSDPEVQYRKKYDEIIEAVELAFTIICACSDRLDREIVWLLLQTKGRHKIAECSKVLNVNPSTFRRRFHAIMDRVSANAMNNDNDELVYKLRTKCRWGDVIRDEQINSDFVREFEFLAPLYSGETTRVELKDSTSTATAIDETLTTAV